MYLQKILIIMLLIFPLHINGSIIYLLNPVHLRLFLLISFHLLILSFHDTEMKRMYKQDDQQFHQY